MIDLKKNSGTSGGNAMDVIRKSYMTLAVMCIISSVGVLYGTKVGFLKGAMGGLIGLGISIGLIILINVFRNSRMALPLLMGFGFLQGIFISPLVYMSSSTAVLSSLAGTAVILFGTSYLALKNKLDSSGWGKYLFFVLIAIIITSLINIFLGSTILATLLSIGVIIVMSGYIVYDTQDAMRNPDTNYVVLTLNFYINILNIFINLLSLFSNED